MAEITVSPTPVVTTTLTCRTRPFKAGKQPPAARAFCPVLDYRLLEPGWAGDLGDDELAYIQQELQRDKKLAYQWGFAPAQKTRPAEAIRRVAMDGDPDHRSINVPLARPRKGARRAKAGPDDTVGRPNSDLVAVS